MAGSMRLVAGKDVWELRVYLGRDSEGRVRHLHRRFRGSKRAAERELARLVAGQEKQPAPVPEERVTWGPTTTVNDAIRAWKDNGWEDLSPKTIIGYESTWKVYIDKSIGRRRIATLSTYEVERFYRQLKKDGAGQSTLRQVKAMLSRACRLARKWSGGTLPNPALDAELPTWPVHERREPVRSPEPDEVRALLAAAGRDERLSAFVRLVAATGMRRGEACALRWSDIDPATRLLSISASVVTADGGAILKAPKTRASIRRLAVDAQTIAELWRLRAIQEALAAECDMAIADDAFVFSYEPGGAVPPHPDTMSSKFAQIRKHAGVAKDIHLHSLRHFQATVLDAVLSERQKQARLGWSTVHMARHYTDVVPEADLLAAEHIGRLLDGGDSTTEPQSGQRRGNATSRS